MSEPGVPDIVARTEAIDLARSILETIRNDEEQTLLAQCAGGGYRDGATLPRVLWLLASTLVWFQIDRDDLLERIRALESYVGVRV